MTNPTPSFRSRLWRFTKRLSLLATVLVVAAVPAVGVGLPVASRTPWARARVEKALTRSFGAPVQVGDLKFSWKQGLRLRDVASASETPGISFKIEGIRLQPSYSKLLQGKLRARATLDNPEITVVDPAPASSTLQFPRFTKKGIRIDKLDIRNGTVLLKGEQGDVRLSDLSTQGAGRAENRTLSLELASVSGSCDGLAFTGKGSLRASQEGLSGELEVKEAAAKESAALRKALRALHLTIKKEPLLSEPF